MSDIFKDIQDALSRLPNTYKSRDYEVSAFDEYFPIAQREMAGFDYDENVLALVDADTLDTIAATVQANRVCHSSKASSPALLNLIVYMLSKKYLISPR